VVEKPRTADPEVIQTCASRIIQSGALGRGHVYPKLLTYLVERALRGEVPKEFDISVDVFGKTRTSVDAPDAQTRVYVYKLRARLDSYYAGFGKADPFRLEIPKGTYHLSAVPDEREARPARRPFAFATYAALSLLTVSLVLNFVQFRGDSAQGEPPVLDDPVWSGLNASARPILIAVGDHFFFGEVGSHVRIRDVTINSKEELRTSAEHQTSAELVFETLTYLPKSTVFALQAVLPRATAAGKSVSLKLVSELTPADLREYDVIYIGFVRAMAILRDYYFSRSNFSSDPPLYMNLAHAESGEVFVRSGPVPQHNRDYGVFARFHGPVGNEILVFAGIGDVGVSAIVRSLAGGAGLEQIEPMLGAERLHAEQGFEVLVEADGHSRTDLDLRVIGAYALRTAAPTPPGALDEAGAGGRLSAAGR